MSSAALRHWLGDGPPSVFDSELRLAVRQHLLEHEAVLHAHRELALQFSEALADALEQRNEALARLAQLELGQREPLRRDRIWFVSVKSDDAEHLLSWSAARTKREAFERAEKGRSLGFLNAMRGEWAERAVSCDVTWRLKP